MVEKKQVILSHKDKIELMKGLVKAERTALSELYGIGEYNSFPDKIRNQVYMAIEKIVTKVARTKDTGCDCSVERETEEVMPLGEVLGELSEGHSVITPKGAYKICKAVGVPYNKELEYHGFSSFEFKGLQMNPDCEGRIIVDIDKLSDYIVNYLHLDVPQFIGRGFQAQANVKAIHKHCTALSGEEPQKEG